MEGEARVVVHGMRERMLFAVVAAVGVVEMRWEREGGRRFDAEKREVWRGTGSVRSLERWDLLGGGAGMGFVVSSDGDGVVGSVAAFVVVMLGDEEVSWSGGGDNVDDFSLVVVKRVKKDCTLSNNLLVFLEALVAILSSNVFPLITAEGVPLTVSSETAGCNREVVCSGAVASGLGVWVASAACS